MSINLDNAAAVLTACAFALLVLPAAGKWKRAACWVVGGAWALLAVLQLLKSFSVSA